VTLAMVFDVEAVGLHGEGFAVGWVTIDLDSEAPLPWEAAPLGPLKDAKIHACPSSYARGTREGLLWVDENCKFMALDSNPRVVREHFWSAWAEAKERRAQLWADVPWPVEANFLSECVKDGRGDRDWKGPYPLYDVATLLTFTGIDRAKLPRLPSELPEHNPLLDAMHSARLLKAAWCWRKLAAGSFPWDPRRGPDPLGNSG